MSAEIVNLADLKLAVTVRGQSSSARGNGAREALIDLANTLPSTLDRPEDGIRWAEWILMEMWDRGFKVVPLSGDE